MIPRYTRPELVRAVVGRPPLRDLAARRAGRLRGDGDARAPCPPGRPPPCAPRRPGKLDPARILEIEERTRHDVIAFLTHVEELAGEPARWLHLGHDVVGRARRVARDPAASRRADEILGGRRPAARRAAAAGADEHARDADDRPLARHPRRADHGRAWCSRGWLRRGRAARGARSSRARDEIAVGKIAGAVGTYAQPRSRRSSARRSASLGLRARDRRRRRSSRAIATPRCFVRAGAAGHRDRAASRSTCGTGSAPRSARRRRRSARARRARRRCRTRRTRSCPRTCAGSRACCASYAQRRRSRTWRCGTSATSRTRRSSASIGARRDGPGRLHGPRAPPALVDGLVVNAERMRANLDLHRRPVLQRGVLLALVRNGHGAPGRLRAGAAQRAAAAVGADGRAASVPRRCSAPTRTSRRGSTPAAIDRVLRPRAPPAPRRRDHRPRARATDAHEHNRC